MWRIWHRRLGLTACLGALLWAASGMLHPVLVRVQPPAANWQAPPLNWRHADAMLSPAALADRHDMDTASLFRLVALPQGVHFQVRGKPGSSLRYFDVRTGIELPDGDRVYARYLARHYAGEPRARINAVEAIERFAGEYDTVNRLLPVYRVQFERPDGLRVYVDTTTSSLGTLVDDRKAVFDWLFRNLHTWSWLRDLEPLRLSVALFFIAAALATAVSGLLTFFATHSPRGLALPAWHRWLGLGAAIFLLAFAASGGLHLVKMSLDDLAAPPRLAPTLSLAGLTLTPDRLMRPGDAAVQSLSLISVDGRRYYRLETGGHAARDHDGGHAHHGSADSAGPSVRFLDADNGNPAVLTETGHARDIAAALASVPAADIRAASQVTTFSGEYGFVNKFLPVIRLDIAGPANEAIYIHAATGTLAARINNKDRFEGYLFAWLHKWHFMEPLGTGVRDILMALAAFLIIIVALLGLALFRRRYRRRMPPGYSPGTSSSRN
ncbi:PepSY domain-containing protein [Salinisphaera sp. P385]|uniref:PepSY domain-containing protein n=1 Tax=Spectribacter acetivorans TaxID=3075603 RepID=A0ABU3B6C0_9GAMM|nr:PepSY domain-containing protein [Salinisphaera sp. P385]MDT0617992.1 PepSY domain-containing protein [Salinisphaera sp. P385]